MDGDLIGAFPSNGQEHPIVCHWDKTQLESEFKLLPHKAVVRNFCVVCDKTNLGCASLRRKIVAEKKINRT